MLALRAGQPFNPQSFNRPPWERMMRFHHLIREMSYPNCNKVAKEFEVSWRTIMRDHLNLHIEFDHRIHPRNPC